jgi:hypothetical protein
LYSGIKPCPPHLAAYALEEFRITTMSGVALFVIVFLIIGLAAQIVFLGSLPGKIASKRNHPYADGVNAASWIGLATGVFWPVAFIWAFCPPASRGGSAAAGSSDDQTVASDVEKLQQQVTSLEAALAELQSAGKAGA